MRPRRGTTFLACAVTAVVLTGLSPAVAAGEPADDTPTTPIITTVPEVPAPAGRMTFVDNPAIVDSHPQGIESWNRLPDDHAVAVQFTTGTPECFGVHVEVQETTDIVAVKLRSGTLPEAVGRACTMIAVFGTVTAALQTPVGDRAVVSIT
ncbi:hypothetical protein BH10ACT9_BH10ACT9_02390 [soil metagenome]